MFLEPRYWSHLLLARYCLASSYFFLCFSLVDCSWWRRGASYGVILGTVDDRIICFYFQLLLALLQFYILLFLPWWHILSGPIWTFDLVSFMKTLNKQCSDSTSLMWRERNFEELWTIFRSKKKPLLQSIRSKVPDQRCQSRIPPPIQPLWGYFQISIQISSRARVCQSRTQSPRRPSWTRASTPKLSKNCEYHPLYCQTVGEISSDQIRSPWLIFIPKTI